MAILFTTSKNLKVNVNITLNKMTLEVKYHETDLQNIFFVALRNALMLTFGEFHHKNLRRS